MRVVRHKSGSAALSNTKAYNFLPDQMFLAEIAQMGRLSPSPPATAAAIKYWTTLGGARNNKILSAKRKRATGGCGKVPRFIDTVQ
jgi:hypothetical protein